MDCETRNILFAADEKGHWEFPPRSKKGVSLNEIDLLAPAIEELFNLKLDVDRSVQDASFLTNVGFVDADRSAGENSSDLSGCLFVFRFSNFGRLYTLIGGLVDENSISGGRLENVQYFLSERGFTFIPADDLESIYDGKNKPFEEGLTWWTRFFDYL